MQSQFTPGPHAPTARALLATIILGLAACGDDNNGITPPAPSIDVQLYPATLSLLPGQLRSVAVSIAREGDFEGSVALAVSGAPAGLTTTLNPDVVAAGAWSSVLTVTAVSPVAPGTYVLTITGSASGVDSKSATLVVTVMPLPVEVGYFRLELSSRFLSMVQGQSGTVDVLVVRGGSFTGSVALAVAGVVPGGVNATFDPQVITDGIISHMTITSAASVPPGSYTITVTGEGSAVGTHEVQLQLTIVAGPASAVSLWFLPGDEFAWTVQGDSWDWPGVTITRAAGFTGAVALSIEGLPQGVTASFSPSLLSGTTTTSTVTFTAEADAPPSVTYVTIRAKSAGIPDATTTFKFIVFPPATD